MVPPSTATTPARVVETCSTLLTSSIMVGAAFDMATRLERAMSDGAFATNASAPAKSAARATNGVVRGIVRRVSTSSSLSFLSQEFYAVRDRSTCEVASTGTKTRCRCLSPFC